MEGGHHQRAGATLRGADDAVAAGRQALVGGQPVRAARRKGRSPTAGCRPVPSWCRGSRRHPRVRPPRCPCRRACSSRCRPSSLLTSGAALNASSRNTAWGPPAWKATGMSRPIAADGTISNSTPSALAVGLSPTTARGHSSQRSRTPESNPRLIITQPHRRPRVPAHVVNHITTRALRKWLTAATPERIAAASPFRAGCPAEPLGAARLAHRGRRPRAQHPLDVGLHLLQLRAPVAPAVRAVGREVEHTVLATRGDVLLLERLVGPQREALEELRAEQVARAVPASRSDGLPLPQ